MQPHPHMSVLSALQWALAQIEDDLDPTHQAALAAAKAAARAARGGAMRPNYLPIIQLCVDLGLREGYRAATARQAEPPCEDDLVCDQYHRTMFHLNLCFAFDGPGYDDADVNRGGPQA